MWKLLKSLPSAFVVALVVAAIASAAPKPHAAVEEPAPTGVTAPAPDTETDPVETPPVETEPAPESQDEDPTADDGSGGPDFSACAGMTGLDNAICRHDQLLAVHPDNQGLANSKGHLEDNKAKHEGAAGAGEDAEGDVTQDGGTDTTSTGHGNSGNGNGGGNGNGNGNGGGNGNANGHGSG